MQRAGAPPGPRARFALWRVPALVGLVSALGSALVSHALALREREQLSLLVETSASRVRAEIRAELDARMHSLSILAREWQERLQEPRSDWESDVRLLLSEEAPGLQSIAWLDPSGAHDWIYPPDAERPRDVAEPVANLPAPRSPIVVGPVLPSGGGAPRLQVLAPLVERGAPAGWLAASYASHELFAEILASIDPTFSVDVSAGAVELFRGRATGRAADPVSHTSLELPGGVSLGIEVEPTDEMIAAALSPLPSTTLACGLALSALLAVALFLRNAAQRAGALEVEIRGHEGAQREVRRLNAELEQRVRERTADLESSNQELQRFASFLSHELRQPLGTQMIWIGLLESEAEDVLDATCQRHLGNIRAMALKMADLISAQIASTVRTEASTERVDLVAVVRDAQSQIAPQLFAIGAKVRVGKLPIVLGDARQLTQLVRNLLENALKYRREDVPVEIAIEAPAAEAAFGDQFEILVEDNGRGFALEDAERIFEPLERLEAEDTLGQGLGLAICKSIVERHGGTLGAEGRPGEGATFRIALPKDRIYR